MNDVERAKVMETMDDAICLFAVLLKLTEGLAAIREDEPYTRGVHKIGSQIYSDLLSISAIMHNEE